MEVNKKLGNETNTSLTNASYPSVDNKTETIDAIEWAKTFITQIRNIRSEGNISPDKVIEIHLSKGSELDRHHYESTEAWIKQLCKSRTHSLG